CRQNCKPGKLASAALNAQTGLKMRKGGKMRVPVLVLFAACLIAASLAVLGASAASNDKPSADPFATMVKVLNHPRCMNCHTTVDWPTVGDDLRRHPLNVTRGKD